MQLSEAIRLGSSLHPQHFGHYFAYYQQEVYASCALGAACMASGIGAEETPIERYNKLNAVFPILEKRLCNGNKLRDEVIIMNDVIFESREKIADYVQTVENANPELCVKEEIKEIVPQKVLV